LLGVVVITFEFEKLHVYEEARVFRSRIYKLAKLLPAAEFKLGIQMRDAARSLTNCLAEGHGRYTFRDRVHFCRESRGSLQELVDDVNICLDQGYAKPEHLKTLRQDAAALLRSLNGYMKYLRSRENETPSARKGKPGNAPITD
jgi:four helix bundle protein